ncbi:MAG: hypothetical protein U0X39_05685 [Bacteroidales bacterium]
MEKLKKYFIIALFLTVTLKALAPNRDAVVIQASDPVNPYRKLMWAVAMVETKHNTLAYNEIEEAAGIFQIRPVRLEDYNIRTGNKYTRADLFKYEVSEKIFLYYASKIGPNDFERIARNWNGSGPKTYLYWNRVKKVLQST